MREEAFLGGQASAAFGRGPKNYGAEFPHARRRCRNWLGKVPCSVFQMECNAL